MEGQLDTAFQIWQGYPPPQRDLARGDLREAPEQGMTMSPPLRHILTP
jgi:hypothetical protein